MWGDSTQERIKDERKNSEEKNKLEGTQEPIIQRYQYPTLNITKQALEI